MVKQPAGTLTISTLLNVWMTGFQSALRGTGASVGAGVGVGIGVGVVGAQAAKLKLIAITSAAKQVRSFGSEQRIILVSSKAPRSPALSPLFLRGMGQADEANCVSPKAIA
jgi:hypothetical protein